jgi:hypothetical protein
MFTAYSKASTNNKYFKTNANEMLGRACKNIWQFFGLLKC